MPGRATAFTFLTEKSSPISRVSDTLPVTDRANVIRVTACDAANWFIRLLEVVYALFMLATA